jgi:hypothetical protein
MSKMVQNAGEGVIPKAIQTITMAQRRGRRPESPVGVGTPPRRQSAVPGQKNGDLPAKNGDFTGCFMEFHGDWMGFKDV